MAKHIPSLKIGQVNDTLQNTSAILEVNATDKGVLLPRMTNAQMLAIASPATGLLVYQTDGTAGLYQYNGSAWVGFGSANDITYETWSTDANYTTVNTTAKRLIVLQTGTLTAPRTLTLSNVPSVGQEVLIVASGSVSATNKISVTCGFKINVTLNSFDIVTAYSQTLLTSTSTNSFTTGQATPQFVETSNALTASKAVRSTAQIGIGSTTSWTSPFSITPVFGDLVYRSGFIIGAGDNAGGTTPSLFAPFDPRNGWVQYRPIGVGYPFGLGYIQAGTKPPIYQSNTGSYIEYWDKSYRLILTPESSASNSYYECIFYVDNTGIPSITKVIKDTGGFTVSVGSGRINISGANCFGYIQQLFNAKPNEYPALNQTYSNDGLTNYWAGNLGIGHTSQSAGAMFQVDSTSKGSLPIPRMTNAQMLALGNLVQGLLVDQTDSVSGYPSGIYRYSGSAWVGFGNISGSGTTNTFPIFTGSGTVGNSAFTYEPSVGRYNLFGKVGGVGANTKVEFYSEANQSTIGFYRNTSTQDAYILGTSGNLNLTHNTGGVALSAYGGNSSVQLFTSTIGYYTTLYHQFFCGGVQVGYFTSASLIMLKDVDIQGTAKLYSAGGIVAGGSSLNAKAILQADSTDKGFLPPRMTLAQRSAITSVPIGLIVYQTDGTEGLYVYRNSGWTLLASAANNIRQVDVQLFNYALQQDVSYADAGTITTFINLNNQLTSATYQKFTYSAGVWSGGSITNITFTAGVSTVSIAMAQYDFIRVVGVLAGANTQATLSIKTTIS